jgi:hypothetical protein
MPSKNDIYPPLRLGADGSNMIVKNDFTEKDMEDDIIEFPEEDQSAIMNITFYNHDKKMANVTILYMTPEYKNPDFLGKELNNKVHTTFRVAPNTERQLGPVEQSVAIKVTGSQKFDIHILG